MVLPGPGLVLVLAGVAVLTKEYSWAQRLHRPVQVGFRSPAGGRCWLLIFGWGTMRGEAEGEDVVDLLIDGHREVEGLFRQLEAPVDSRERCRRLINGMTIELARHTMLERQYLYATVRYVLDDGNKVADEGLDEHARVERLLKDLERTEKNDQQVQSLLGSLLAEVRRHIAEMEADVFPRLRERCSKDELVELGRKLATAKQPTSIRPHPAGPDASAMSNVPAALP